MNLSDLTAICLQEAIATASAEAKKTPIEIGKLVGHTDFDKFGTATGKLTAYDGEEALVTNILTNEEYRWEKAGMVDILRVYLLAADYMKLIGVIQLLTAMGVSDEQIAAVLSRAIGPTPGCTCAHCMTFSEKEREAANKTAATEPPAAATATDDLLSQLRAAADKFN